MDKANIVLAAYGFILLLIAWRCAAQAKTQEAEGKDWLTDVPPDWEKVPVRMRLSDGSECNVHSVAVYREPSGFYDVRVQEAWWKFRSESVTLVWNTKETTSCQPSSTDGQSSS